MDSLIEKCEKEYFEYDDMNIKSEECIKSESECITSCGKEYNQPNDLDRKFDCKSCEKTFSNKYILKTHVNSFHNQQWCQIQLQYNTQRSIAMNVKRNFLISIFSKLMLTLSTM